MSSYWGSLTVGGVIHQPEEHQALIVVGDLRCASAELRGATWVRGSVETRLIYLERYGYLHGKGSITADLVLRDSYESDMLSPYRALRDGHHCFATNGQRRRDALALRVAVRARTGGARRAAPSSILGAVTA
jgi:hypothetical protein